MPKLFVSQLSVSSRLVHLGSLVILSLGLGWVAACGKTSNALMVVEQTQNSASALQAMSEADVLYLGEHHTSVADHAAQLEIIQAMHQKNPKVAIALEMVQRPFQASLDQYIAGEIDEATMLEQTEYAQRWGFPWELYAPIYRYAQQHQIPLLALNTPSEISHKIAKTGLESLSGEDLKYIPAIDEIDTTNEAYQSYVAKAFGDHSAHGSFNFDNFFAAQVTWDETMADVISQFKQANPDIQVIVLAGQGHVVYGYGIPERVERRLGDDLKQQAVLLNLSSPPQDPEIADILWNSPAVTLTTP